MTVVLASIGDRLGLFKDLANGGPATAAELAQRCGVNERYALEWLRGMTTAGYLEHDRQADNYTLPAEHVPVLAQEAGPMFLCGGYQMLPGLTVPFDRLVEVFQNGGGVSQDEYGADVWEGMQRFTDSWIENQLFGEWMPALPHVVEKLESGATAADVGCGAGRASIAFAKAYPNSTFIGFDAFEGQLELARRNAEKAGVADQVSFELLDGSKGLPDTYDLVTTFDVIHDSVDPQGLLKSIRASTKDDGDYLMLEINCADDPADNEGDLGSLFYGFSVTYCMTTSLAHGGAGLGTCGMPRSRVDEYCKEAGFSTVDVAAEDPFNLLYDIRP